MWYFKTVKNLVECDLFANIRIDQRLNNGLDYLFSGVNF